MNYETPLEWKSERWWRNRPREERLHHIHLVPRMKGAIDEKPPKLEWFTDWQPGKSLIITGPAGSGKSTLAANLVYHLVKERGIVGRWVYADDYIEMLKDSFSTEDGLLPEMYNNPHLPKYIKKVFDVVVLDGLGDDRNTEFAQHELGSVIRQRYDSCRSTIITTRLSMADIQARYGLRLSSVINNEEVFEQVNTPRGR